MGHNGQREKGIIRRGSEADAMTHCVERFIGVVLIVMFLAGCGPLMVQKSSRDPSFATKPELSSHTYGKSREEIAQAAIIAMQKLGWTVDHGKTSVPFVVVGNAPMSLWTYGDIVEANFSLDNQGQTVVDVSSRTEGQVGDWGKNEENVKKFYAALDAVIATGQSFASAGNPSRSQFSQDIIVTTGPLSQPYEALGEVYVNTVGEIYLGSLLNDTLFRSPLARSIQATPATNTVTMNEKLRQEARSHYGGRVDAVVNVSYRTDPDGDMFASGLAVHFIEPQPTPAPTAPAPTLEQKLTELKNLREKNLITSEEYYEKRSELLKGF